MALLTLKYVFRDELVARLPEILALAGQLLEQDTGLQYLETLLRYLCAGTDRLDAEELRQAVERALPAEGGTLMPTIAEQWIQRGREEGMVQGLELALKLRFGAEGLRLLPEIREVRDAATLKRLLDAIETTGSVDELRCVYAG